MERYCYYRGQDDRSPERLIEVVEVARENIFVAPTFKSHITSTPSLRFTRGKISRESKRMKDSAPCFPCDPLWTFPGISSSYGTR